MKKPAAIVLIVAALLVVLSFWNAPQGEFVYDDDWQVVRNPLIQRPELWGQAMTSDVWAFKSATFATSSNYYRPAFTAWSIANYFLFGLEPAGWHVANILLHLLAIWLALRLLLKLGFSWPVSAVAVWIFAAHPVHVESVTWIAGSPDLLMAVFLLALLLVYLRARASGSRRDWALTIGAMFLAMASKETSLMMAPAVFVIELALSKDEGRADALVRALRIGAAFLGTVVLFFALRTFMLGSLSVGDQSPLALSDVLLSVPQLSFFYLKQAIAPFWLSTAYPLRAVSSGSLTLMSFWVPLIALIATLAAFVALSKQRARWAAAVAIAMFILPAFYVRAFHPEHVVRDRYIYLPLLGLVALLVDLLAARRNESKEFSWGGLTGVGLVVAIGLAYLSSAYNRVWMNDVAMWERGVQTDPQGSMANMQLAEALRESKHPEDAVPYAQKAVELNPSAARPLTILGMSYKDSGDYVRAETALVEATSKDRDTLFAAGQLADLYLQLGRFDEGVKALEDEIVRNPGYMVEGKQNVATLYVLAGRREDAMRELQGIADESKRIASPAGRKTFFLLGQLYRDLSRRDDSAAAFRTYLEMSANATDSESLRMRETAFSYVSD